ncbi:MAG: VanW family protein [Defluviitaleaceae bacterium]|nr:VanW family protein [Defluviitaleaceae bacterium]
MVKILLIFAALLMLSGCSNRRVENAPAYENPTRSINRQPAIDVDYEPMQDAQFDRRTRPRMSGRPMGEPLPAETTPDYSSSMPENGQTPSNRMAHYETKYDASEVNRGINLSLAAGSINGAVVKPGETFSFNETIGSTVAERGYKKGVIFKDGEKSENYGGGVCQVSTTLCNAAINAGMTIVERHDHSLPVQYVGDGKEAATSHNGKLDFKFKNDKPYAITIHAKAENGTVSVSIGEA